MKNQVGCGTIIIGIITLVALILFVAWAWPYIVVIASCSGAGLLGMIMMPFLAFIFWYAFADIFGKTHWEDIDSSSHYRWGVFYSLIGLASGISAHILSEGDFFARYLPILAVSAVPLAALPVFTDFFVNKAPKISPPCINASAIVERVRLQMVDQQELTLDIEGGDDLIYDQKTGEFREVK